MKLTPCQTKKFDINQKIIHEMTNLESRLILFSITKHSREAVDISNRIKVPLSTIYKKLQILEKLSLVYVKRIEIAEGGSKNSKFYQSRVKEIDISISKQEPKITLIKNNT